MLSALRQENILPAPAINARPKSQGYPPITSSSQSRPDRQLLLSHNKNFVTQTRNDRSSLASNKNFGHLNVERPRFLGAVPFTTARPSLAATTPASSRAANHQRQPSRNRSRAKHQPGIVSRLREQLRNRILRRRCATARRGPQEQAAQYRNS